MIVEQDVLVQMQTDQGENLLSLSQNQPVLLVFLRHFGCVFCKEALTDLAEMRTSIESEGSKLVFVHMSANSVANRYFHKYGLDNVAHISDGDQHFYREFGLAKGSFSQLYGLQTWFRGFSAKNRKHKIELAKALGDSTQMPGIFVIHKGEIKESYIHKRVSDKPDYFQLMACCTPTP